MLNLFMAKKLYFSKPLLSVLRIVSILIVSTIGISDSSVAGVLDKYCLSRVGQTEPIEESERVIPQHPVPPYLSRKVKDIREIYRKPCNAFSRFFDACTRETLFYYSPALDRVFFQGYRPTTWGGGFVHLEISEEGTKSVPSELVNSGFMENVPALNGVLFKGRFKREALFYDGSKVTELSQYFSEPRSKYRWNFIQTSENRFFLVDIGIRPNNSIQVLEVKPVLTLEPIPVPDDVKNTWLDLLSLSNDSRIWGITRNNVLAEVEGKLQKVLTVSSPLYIVIPGFVKPVDESILFEIRSEDTESITNYFLREVSPTANCEIMLDEEQPVLLDPELNN